VAFGATHVRTHVDCVAWNAGKFVGLLPDVIEALSGAA
jgi:hypothetical protein